MAKRKVCPHCGSKQYRVFEKTKVMGHSGVEQSRKSAVCSKCHKPFTV